MSTSATWSAIDRLRWRMPMPPSRARAIASRASVTVSIAADTIGISSAIVRVRRVAVRTSFGSTDDSAGTSRTSSKVRPSRPNFSSNESSCPSKEDRVTGLVDGLGARDPGEGSLERRIVVEDPPGQVTRAVAVEVTAVSIQQAARLASCHTSSRRRNTGTCSPCGLAGPAGPSRGAPGRSASTRAGISERPSSSRSGGRRAFRYLQPNGSNEK